MLVELSNLTKEYGSFRALDNLTLSVPAGEIFGLLGPNGSGKSTTLRLLLGMHRPTNGWARIDGHDCWQDSLAVRRKVAYLPGELRLYENLTGRQFLRFLEGVRAQPADEATELLAKRLEINLERPIRDLSSGMKRKLALILVLMARVPLIILDEPTNTLDPVMRDELLALLLQARQRGQTIIFSSHVLQEVEHICDRVAILSRGRLVHLQQMDELRVGRQIKLEFGDTVPSLPTWPNCSWRVDSERGRTLECRDGLPEVLAWLAVQQLSDIRIEPMGLGPIYQRFHANGAAT